MASEAARARRAFRRPLIFLTTPGVPAETGAPVSA
jgi:hypothetical protein